MVKSKTLSGKYSQKRLHHAKESATDALKATSKKAVQKTAEATGDLIGNKIRGGSRINFRVLQNFTKKIEHRNDVICRK